VSGAIVMAFSECGSYRSAPRPVAAPVAAQVT
jgi:hypothetical protein